MDEKTLILGVLTKLLNKTDEELTGLLFEKSDDGSEKLKDDALDVSIDLVEQKVSKIKGSQFDEKKLRDDISKRVKNETLTNFEKEIREKYNLDSDRGGPELIDDLLAKFKSDDSALTPDKIKLTDTFRDMEKEFKKRMKDLEKNHEIEIETLKKTFQKKDAWNVIGRDIRKKLAEVSPVLPKNQKAADNLVELFVSSFADYEWQVDKNGKHLATKDGKRIEDNLGNEIDFDNLVSGRISEYFDIPAQRPKGGAGNEGGGSGNGVPQSFKDETEYLKFLDTHPDLASRSAAKKVYQAQYGK